MTSNSVLTNNFYNNSPAHIQWEGVAYSDVALFNSAFAYASGNISCDPEFIVPGNFHLLSTSCCNDAGTFFSSVAEDLDGDPRSPPPDLYITCISQQ